MADQRILRQDMQVHSTFSDGKSTIEENVAEAEQLGLLEMTCVDHVRASTDWLPEYVAAVSAINDRTSIELRCGVEAKLLDTDGRLDLPDELDGVDAIYAADHQVPFPDGPHTPSQTRAEIEDGTLAGEMVLEHLVTATRNAVKLYEGAVERLVICHLFSVIPKLGLAEDEISLELIESLADDAESTGAFIEVDERWMCPSPRTLRPFLVRGIAFLVSTDSHQHGTIGRYDYCATVVDELSASGLLA